MLTNEQEAALIAMLAAYKEGKKISDLDDISGDADPTVLVIEVEENGVSKKTTLGTAVPIDVLEANYAYGVEKDQTDSSTAWTRVGNMELHRTLPVQSAMYGCLLDDDGNEVEKLPADTWEESVRDGSAGQVMVCIPEHYVKFTTDGDVYRVMMSLYALPGYTRVPKMYVSAYQAALDRDNLKLASVRNFDAQYRGGANKDEYDDGEYNTQLGRPATVISLTNFRKYARARNGEATTEWNCMTYLAQRTVYWLYIVEYANGNCQLDYNAELTEDGYHQGGLGAGVTTWSGTAWQNLFDGSNYYPFLPCGCTDALGSGTGTVNYTLIDADGAEKSFDVPRYRGIENPFGHIWQWTDGVHFHMTADTTDEDGNVTQGLSEAYATDDPAAFQDSNYDGYDYIGDVPHDSDYMQTIIGGARGDILPSSTGGGSTTYWGDYWYTSHPSSGEALHGLLFGGCAYAGGEAGFGCAHAYHAPSFTSAYIGSRLCFHPAQSESTGANAEAAE